MINSRVRPDFLVLNHLLLFLLLGAFTLWIAGVSLRSFLLICIILSLILPLALKYLRRQLDLFEPLVLANLSLGVMFVGGPLADIQTRSTFYIGYDIESRFDEALVVALIGIIAFQLGYLSPLSQNLARWFPKPGNFHPNSAFWSAWLFIAIGSLLFGVFLSQNGGLSLLFFLLQGRAPSNDTLFRSTTGYLYQSIVIWASSIMIFFVLWKARKRFWYLLLFCVFLFPYAFFYVARGSRINLLPLFIAVPVFSYLYRRKRPSLWIILVVMMIGSGFLGWIREIRNVDSPYRDDALSFLIESISNPFSESEAIITGIDNGMFDALAAELMVVPEILPYRPGGTLTDILIRAIPRTVWPEKPLEMNDAVVATLWPEHYRVSRASSAFSIIGPLYADSGILSVAAGMFVIGVLTSAFWRWYLSHRSSVLALLIYSTGLPFVVILMRGTLPGTLAHMLYAWIPLVVLLYIRRVRL